MRFPCSVVALVLTTVASAGCKGEGPTGSSQAATPSPSPRAVRVVPAAQQALPRTVVATGTLAAQEQVVLGVKVAGRLAQISSGVDEEEEQNR